MWKTDILFEIDTYYTPVSDQTDNNNNNIIMYNCVSHDQKHANPHFTNFGDSEPRRRGGSNALFSGLNG